MNRTVTEVRREEESKFKFMKGRKVGRKGKKVQEKLILVRGE